jgi:glucose/arabinose dehydrogenase
MLEHEIQKLTAAIVELIATMREHAKPPAQAQAPEPTPASAPAPEPTPAPEPASTATPLGVTRDGLKEISLQIVRADTAKKKDIVAILEAHGAQTITKLADAHILAVHGQFLALSQQVMEEARR